MPIPLAILPDLAYATDVASRSDAITGLVISEPDYISTWLTTLRNQWRMLGGQADTAFMTLPSRHERILGCDGMVAVEDTNTGLFKILLFEAKQIKPRMDQKIASNSVAAQVEYLIAALPSKHSHFSDQIARQAQCLLANPQLAIIELFICFAAPLAPFIPPIFDDYGSTCVDHVNARNHVSPPGAVPPLLPFNKAWAHIADLPVVCGMAPGRNLQAVFQELIACTFGQPLHHPDGLQGILVALGDGVQANLPQHRNLATVLQHLGLRYFLHVTGRADGWAQAIN
jgi:hypothetical protein